MKKLFLIALGLAIWPPDTSATTVYCSTVTCGDYDEINSAGFCGSSFKWCKPSFQSTFGNTTYYSEYKYCMPYGGYYLYNGENYKASHNIVCYSDQEICETVAQLQVPWTDYGDYSHPAKGYFIGGKGCTSGTTKTSDYSVDTYGCPAGEYNRYGVRAIESDGSSGLGCSSCSTGYYSGPASISSDCVQCPLAEDIYTDSALSELPRGTTGTKQTAKTDCYLPIGTYYDETGKININTTACTY